MSEELVAIPRRLLEQMEEDIADLKQAVGALLRDEEPGEAFDPVFARFLEFRKRARAAEPGLEVPWRT